MCSLFVLSEKMGLSVSGSDRERGCYTDHLIKAGARIIVGSDPGMAASSDLLVYSLAVGEDDAELLAAEKKGVPCISRAEYLGALMQDYRVRIGVSGSHGKSTVSSMLDAIFTLAGKRPTSVIGANISDVGLPIRVGDNDVLVYEACEYKDSFLRFSPTAAVFTNLEMDHADYFENIDVLVSSFKRAMAATPLIVYNYDDARLSRIARDIASNAVSYGIASDADFRATDIRAKNGKYCFKILYAGGDEVNISLSVPGKFNVSNALGAFALAYTLGIPARVIEEALSRFSGVERRIELVGVWQGASVYYDYAHHPTEISNTVSAVRDMTEGEITVIFRPHTYSRTAALMDDFAVALSSADSILLAEIEGIREGAIEGISSSALAAKIGGRARLIDEKNLISELSRHKSGAIIIMGAANLSEIKNIILGKNKGD
ncbi:MAG: UDP-N-acetylmuramate--L-alanine ligase [Clostridia bacterium]|nr:UDP-N-acetylmuramate--L-alanine ligase [Clostridia bacterium]